MKMNDDEKFLDIVFKRLKLLSFQTPKGNYARYVLEATTPDLAKEGLALYKLNDWGVAKIRDRETDSNTNNLIFYLEIDKDKIDEYFSNNQKSNKVKYNTEKPYFFIEDYTFRLLKNDDLYGTIDFHLTKNSNNTDPFILMEAFISALKENGNKDGDWIEVSVSRERLTQKILQIHSEYKDKLTSDWYKTTKGNLIKKIPENLISLIDFQYFDNKTNTYKLRLKLPQLH